jgi:hypothetical protein
MGWKLEETDESIIRHVVLSEPIWDGNTSSGLHEFVESLRIAFSL